MTSTPHITLEGGRLTHDGQNVTAKRAFPWSHPNRMIVLRDAEGHEVACLDDLAGLAAEVRDAVTAWLDAHTFVPRVTAVRSVREVNAATLLDVATDRGDVRLLVREREDLRPLADGRTLVRDADGQIYALPPLEGLAAESRRALSALL